eukprot:TRINITY_DN3309_c0_g2_i1.p1 TRINITY_DN3309_c0_g2~~TRINITY_DN3309_c0_g2_i1.p1  ORF type:complete len:335 (+),score=44.64 TRINITY_DN3309_c0_g2_i1:159-1163(+)
MSESKPFLKSSKDESDKDRRNTTMSKKGIIVALAYMTCAVMLVMFNKAALSSYNFPYVNVITLLQMVCSNILLYTLRSWNMVTFGGDGSKGLDDAGKGFVPLRTIRKAAPLSISYLFYMVVGMASIRGVSVPMYTTLRRTTVVFTMLMEQVFQGTRHSSPIMLSVAIIVGGAFIAGVRDLSFEPVGYALVFLSNFTTAVYLTFIGKLGKSTGLNSFGLMWCNGVICMPILLIWSLISGELVASFHFVHINNLGFQLVMLMSCVMAFCLNYTIFLNTALNSALTQTMCGNFKDLGVVSFGWLWFGGLPFDWLNVVGQGLGFIGSGLYAWSKLRGR